ncbi:MAG: hypothetical protein QOF08_1767, partial [Gaiellales bacterium]|nr:hypothetical protein [Gaiellales bacterium]
MSRPVSNFHTTTLARPVPGAIGTDATVYLAVLGFQGLAPSSRYEYHRELTRLAAMFPDVGVGEISRPMVDRYLVQRAMIEQQLSVSSRRKIMACLSGFFAWAASSGLCPHGNPVAGIIRPPLTD